jgi:hypothetical protein
MRCYRDETFINNSIITLCGDYIKSSFNKDRSFFKGEFWFMLIWEKQVLHGLYTDCAFNDILNQAGYFFF